MKYRCLRVKFLKKNIQVEYQAEDDEDEEEENTGTSRNNIPGEATLRQNFLKLQQQEENKKEEQRKREKENDEKNRRKINEQRYFISYKL